MSFPIFPSLALYPPKWDPVQYSGSVRGGSNTAHSAKGCFKIHQNQKRVPIRSTMMGVNEGVVWFCVRPEIGKKLQKTSKLRMKIIFLSSVQNKKK